MDDDFVVPTVAPLAGGLTPTPSKRRRQEAPSQTDNTCFVLSCQTARKAGKKWCAHHNSAYDVMYYQAKTADPPKKDVLDSMTSDATLATEVMEDFDRENVAHMRFKKKNMVNFARWEQRLESFRQTTTREGSDPVEARQFMLWGTNTMGWSEAETRSEWDRYKGNPSIERDAKGLNGAIRLWIPRMEAKYQDRTMKSGASFVESSKDKTGTKEDERAALIRCLMAKAQGSVGPAEAMAFLGGNQDFFASGANLAKLAAAGTPSGSEAASPSGQGGDTGTATAADQGSKPEPAESAKEKRARLRLEKLASGPAFTSHRASMVRTVSDAVEALRSKGEESLRWAKEVRQKVQAAVNDADEDVVVLKEYLENVAVVRIFLETWLGAEVFAFFSSWGNHLN